MSHFSSIISVFFQTLFFPERIVLIKCPMHKLIPSSWNSHGYSPLQINPYFSKYYHTTLLHLQKLSPLHGIFYLANFLFKIHILFHIAYLDHLVFRDFSESHFVVVEFWQVVCIRHICVQMFALFTLSVEKF